MNQHFVNQDRKQVAQIQLLAQQSNLFAAQNNQKVNMQLSLFDVPNRTIIKKQYSLHNSDTAHSLYEHCLQLIIQNLPKCEKPFLAKNRQLNEAEHCNYQQQLVQYHCNNRIKLIILEARNVFLTGKNKDKNGIRGASGRSAPISRMLELKTIVEFWIQKGADAAELFRELQLPIIN